mmetsp:Transcript_117698/g.333008  ORF Transcript_117698/g.333008 Transcript_117698/m.333008 type:complete len:101 (+) Transcript_117698:2906-3208(+)
MPTPSLFWATPASLTAYQSEDCRRWISLGAVRRPLRALDGTNDAILHPLRPRRPSRSNHSPPAVAIQNNSGPRRLSRSDRHKGIATLALFLALFPNGSNQ